MHSHLTKCPSLCLGALTLLASLSSAHDDSNLSGELIRFPIAVQQAGQQSGQLGPAGGSQHLVPVFFQSVDLAISDKSFQLGYRENNVLQDGFWNAEFLVNDENDIALNARMMRVGQVVGTPVRLGVGLGVYGVFFDESGDKLYALALVGSAQYDLPTSPPTTASLELALAPDISTFRDGEDLLDLSLRLEVEVSKSALAFVGLRFFDANTINDSEFTSELHIGVRLSL